MQVISFTWMLMTSGCIHEVCPAAMCWQLQGLWLTDFIHMFADGKWLNPGGMHYCHVLAAAGIVVD
jgi:hypothetical protein